MSVYLAGPIAGCTDLEASGWRDTAARALGAVRDPMVRDARRGNFDPWELVADDKADIRRSDAVLAYCWKPGWGTAMEILYAHTLEIPVIAVVPPELELSPWIRYHATFVVRHLSAGIEIAQRFADEVLRESILGARA